MATKAMEHKQFDAVITSIDETQGIVKAVFAVMGNVDEGNDRIWPGAFAKTFVERGGKVLVLDNHNTNSTADVIAKPISLKELTRNQLPPEILDKYPDAMGGAEITAQFEPDKNKDERSAAAFYRLKNKWVKSWSFGYDAMDYDFTSEQVGTKEVQVRNLRTIKLYEASPVLFPMNDAAMTTDAKASKPTEGKPYSAIREDGKWRVYKLDADGKPTGKPLGEHDTEDEARAQVGALYANTDDETPDKSDEPVVEKKAGRVLARRNADRIKRAYDALKEALDDAGILAMLADDEEDEDEETTGPQKSAPAPTSSEAGPQEQKEAPVDYLTLIKIERLKADVWR